MFSNIFNKISRSDFDQLKSKKREDSSHVFTSTGQKEFPF